MMTQVGVGVMMMVVVERMGMAGWSRDGGGGGGMMIATATTTMMRGVWRGVGVVGEVEGYDDDDDEDDDDDDADDDVAAVADSFDDEK